MAVLWKTATFYESMSPFLYISFIMSNLWVGILSNLILYTVSGIYIEVSQPLVHQKSPIPH